MKRTKTKRPTKAHEKSVVARHDDEYLLRLYVAGTSSRSRQAILSARELCSNELNGHCKLEVIDIYQDPIRARDGQIVATPTLVRELPLPVRRLIGTLARASRLFVGLRLDTPRKSDS
jgi:circadian clock protein KaiB